jgi:hypothetical protein
MAEGEKDPKNLRRDPDMQNAERALRRAALRARERAQQTTGYIVIFRDGKIIHEPVDAPNSQAYNRPCIFYEWGKADMDIVAERLDAKLREWPPATAEQVRQRVTEIIDLADQGVLDIMRSRVVEQEVLDLLDEPTTR